MDNIDFNKIDTYEHVDYDLDMFFNQVGYCEIVNNEMYCKYVLLVNKDNWNNVISYVEDNGYTDLYWGNDISQNIITFSPFDFSETICVVFKKGDYGTYLTKYSISYDINDGGGSVMGFFDFVRYSNLEILDPFYILDKMKQKVNN
jgi:uncharacterized linocin/CFP29 family protein